MMKNCVQISERTNFTELSNKLSRLGSSMILKSLHLSNKIKQFLLTKMKMKLHMLKLKRRRQKFLNEKAKIILAKINALNPNPGTWLEYNKARIKITKAVEIKKNGNPGEIISDKFSRLFRKFIQILELQKEGKKV